MTNQDKSKLKLYVRDVFLFLLSWMLIMVYFFYIGPMLLSQDVTATKRIFSIALTFIYWPIVPIACLFYTLELPYVLKEIYELLAEKKTDETI